MLRIEFARRELSWSQEKLGQQAGITQAFVSLIELGRGIPTPAQAQRLAELLNLTPDILLQPVVLHTTPSSEADKAKLAAAHRAARAQGLARERVARLEAEVARLRQGEVAR